MKLGLWERMWGAVSLPFLQPQPLILLWNVNESPVFHSLEEGAHRLHSATLGGRGEEGREKPASLIPELLGTSLLVLPQAEGKAVGRFPEEGYWGKEQVTTQWSSDMEVDIPSIPAETDQILFYPPR